MSSGSQFSDLFLKLFEQNKERKIKGIKKDKIK